MGLRPEMLPVPSAYDFSAEPPGGMDPLGFMSLADMAADTYLAGFTARMWRPRFLTFAAVASVVADRMVTEKGARLSRKEARLAFERLFVQAIVQSVQDGTLPPEATRRLPGSSLALGAIRRNEPLSRENYLVAAAVNGPFGVIARLARNLGLVGPDDRPVHAEDLVEVWSREQGLPGFLEDGAADGARIMKHWVRKSLDHLENPSQPARPWLRGSRLQALRPDKLGAAERKFLLARLTDAREPLRRAFLEVLAEPAISKHYRKTESDGDGDLEQEVVRACLNRLSPRDDSPRPLLRRILVLADAFQQVAVPMRQVFDAARWALARRAGSASAAVLLKTPVAEGCIRRACAKLPQGTTVLASAMAALDEEPLFTGPLRSRMELLLAQAREASRGSGQALRTVLDRHRLVQTESRNKESWIDEDGHQLVLRPGFDPGGEEPPDILGRYNEALRVANAGSFLEDLS